MFSKPLRKFDEGRPVLLVAKMLCVGKCRASPRQLGLETVSRRIFSVLFLRSDVLVLRKMSPCWCRSWLIFYFLFPQFQNVPSVVHTPFFIVISFTDERAMSIVMCNFSVHSFQVLESRAAARKARCRSCSFRFKVRRQHSLQV